MSKSLDGRLAAGPSGHSPDPDKFKTVAQYLQAQGKLKLTTDGQLKAAAKMYIKECRTEQYIGEVLDLEPAIVMRWAITFDWEERRDARLRHKWQKLAGMRKGSKNVDERVDRIYSSIESLAERFIQDHVNGDGELDPRALKVLAETIKISHEGRRVIANVKGPAKEVNVNTKLDIGGQLGKMLTDALAPARLPNTEQISLDVGDVQDAEFETLGDDDPGLAPHS